MLKLISNFLYFSFISSSDKSYNKLNELDVTSIVLYIVGLGGVGLTKFIISNTINTVITLKHIVPIVNNLKLNGLNDKQMQYTFLLMYANNKISYDELKLFLAKINSFIDEELDSLSDEERKVMIKNMFSQYE